MSASGTNRRSAWGGLGYRPELDVLRFSAFLGVFFYHATPHEASAYARAGQFAPWIAALFRSGSFGVDLFFALSSYLITSLLLEEKELWGSVDVKAFYLRRILRIWPLYFAFLLFAVLLNKMGFHSQSLTAPYLAGYALLAGNWIYVAYGLPHSVTVPLWSVSIEEQFYLLWPLVVRKCGRQMIGRVASLLLLATFCGTVALLAITPASPEYRFEFNTLIRLYPVALGILFALFSRRGAAMPSAPIRMALLCGGIATWVVVSRYCRFDVHAPAKILDNVVGRPAIALASVAILAATLGATGPIVNRVTIWLGKISYGLYVIHAFGLVLAAKLLERHRVPFAGVATMTIGLLTTVGLAAVLYRWLETPFLSLKNRFTRVATSREQMVSIRSCKSDRDAGSAGKAALMVACEQDTTPAA
jgi:peptidoglycan/LPS O-acetylase OafA/YrhL